MAVIRQGKLQGKDLQARRSKNKRAHDKRLSGSGWTLKGESQVSEVRRFRVDFKSYKNSCGRGDLVTSR